MTFLRLSSLSSLTGFRSVFLYTFFGSTDVGLDRVLRAGLRLGEGVAAGILGRSSNTESVEARLTRDSLFGGAVGREIRRNGWYGGLMGVEFGVVDGEPSSPDGKCTRDELGVAGCGIATILLS